MIRTKYVLSVWAPSARVVYAVSPLAKSEVKSQNLPSSCRQHGPHRGTTGQTVTLTLCLAYEADSRRQLLCSFRRRGYARDEGEAELVL